MFDARVRQQRVARPSPVGEKGEDRVTTPKPALGNQALQRLAREGRLRSADLDGLRPRLGNQAIQRLAREEARAQGTPEAVVEVQTAPNPPVVVQPWRDQAGKYHDGAEPPDKENWEKFVPDKGNFKGFELWRPKTGAGTTTVKKEEKEKEEEPDLLADGMVHLLDPALVRYTQDSIDSTFSDGGNIYDTATALINGTKKPSEIPAVRCYSKKVNGKLRYISYDNRRVWCFKQAKLVDPSIKMQCIRATEQQQKDLASHITATQGTKGGGDITVRNASVTKMSDLNELMRTKKGGKTKTEVKL